MSSSPESYNTPFVIPYLHPSMPEPDSSGNETETDDKVDTESESGPDNEVNTASESGPHNVSELEDIASVSDSDVVSELEDNASVSGSDVVSELEDIASVSDSDIVSELDTSSVSGSDVVSELEDIASVSGSDDLDSASVSESVNITEPDSVDGNPSQNNTTDTVPPHIAQLNKQQQQLRTENPWLWGEDKQNLPKMPPVLDTHPALQELEGRYPKKPKRPGPTELSQQNKNVLAVFLQEKDNLLATSIS